MKLDFIELIDTFSESSSHTLNRLLEYIINLYDADEILFYSTVINRNSFVLRGQISYRKMENISAEFNPCDQIKSAMKNQKVITTKNIFKRCKTQKNCPFHIHKCNSDNRNLIILPIPFNKTMNGLFNNNDYCGILIFNVGNHPKNVSDDELIELSIIFSELYCNSILHDKLRLREDIYNNVLKSPDINSFYHRLIELLIMNWHFESISFFKIDERSKLIRLIKTTGLEQKYQKVTDVFYEYNEKYLTVNVVNSGEEIIIVNPDMAYTSGKYTEAVKGRRVVVGIFPIMLPPERKFGTQKVIGVLRISNHLLKLDELEIPTPFTWENILLCRFICQISGEISFLLEGSTQRTITLERMTHGILNYLTASIRSLNQLSMRTNFKSLVPENFKNNLTNVLGNLEAIHWQISKYTTQPLTDKSNLLKKIYLYGEVLAEVVASAKKVSKGLGVKLKISNLVDAGFKEIPAIIGNSIAIKLVFKNIFENAMKYRVKDKCEIDITQSESEEFLFVFVSDRGIGINDFEKEYVFYEGYRSEEAMATNPSGTGFGLFQCRELLDAIGGKIEILNTNNPTIFKLSFRKWEGNDLYN